MGIWVHIKKTIHMMRQRVDIVVFLFSVIFTLFRLWTGANGSLEMKPADVPNHIFDSEFVIDLHDTGLTDFNALLHLSEVSLIFSYAHWCHNSMQAAKHYAEIAEEMQTGVSFIAINCWYNKEVCKNFYVSSTFPQIYLHHRLLKKHIQYNGPHVKRYYKHFLQRALNPIEYIGTSNKVDVFLQNSQVAIIGMLTWPSRKFMLQKYYEVVLGTLQEFPLLSVQFGLVLNKGLSKELQLQDCALKLYDQTISKTHAVRQFYLTSATAASDIIEWISLQPLALNRIPPTRKKSNALYKVLKEGPALVTFSKDIGRLQVVEDVAIRHKSRKQSCCCCKSFREPVAYQSCFNDGNAMYFTHDCTLAHTIIHKFHNSLFNSSTTRLFNRSCVELISGFYGRLEVCPVDVSSTNSVQTQSNNTLNFIGLDIELHQSIAEELGFNVNSDKSSHTAIVDVFNENVYTMDTELSKANLENFLMKYTNQTLLPTKRMKPEKSDSYLTSDLHIPLANEDFEQVVLNSSKDVLVYYHASWCGFCSTSSHVIVSLKAMLGDLKDFEIYQVDQEANERLDVSFKALSFPSLILYSGSRIGDSVRFSPTVPYNLPNLFGFLLRHASPITKAQLLLRTCMKQARGSIPPSSVCRMEEILQRLARY